MYQVINLANFPAPSAVQVWSFDAILAATLDDAVSRLNAAGIAYNVQTLKGNPLNFILSAYAYREGVVLQRINDAVASTFLATATQEADVILRAGDVNITPAPGESVASLKRRTQLVWEALSIGGTYGRYQSNALGGDPVGLAGVAVYGHEQTPVPKGEVWIVCLGSNASGIPSAQTLAAVKLATAARALRPVNDCVKVMPVNPDAYSIDATIMLQPGADAAAVVAAQRAALQKFCAARQVIGGLVTPNNIAAVAGYNAAGLINDVVVRQPSANVGGDAFTAPVLTGIHLDWKVGA
jgi:phage-related baseplate assembly protein